MTLRRRGFVALLVAALLLGVGYGMLARGRLLPPYPQIQKLRKALGLNPALRQHMNSAGWREYERTDPTTLLHVRTPEEVLRRRQALLALLHGSVDDPLSTTVRVEETIGDARYDGLSALDRIDRITIEMEFGLNSVAYWFHPRRPRGALVIYHEGHDGDFARGRPVIARLLEEGYTVAGLAMPLMGMNNRPVVATPCGSLQLVRHGQLSLLELAQGSPLRFFVDPVAAILDLAEGRGFAGADMVGISGGGWVTTLAAALDPRIQRSIPVAGSLPLYMRWAFEAGDWGDWEENEPALCRVASYLDLYVLGASPQGRRQLQILNLYDPVCFDGRRAEHYADVVGRAAADLGGSYELWLDDTHDRHAISEAALERILAELAAPTAP